MRTEREAHARVVHLAVEVDERRLELLALQHREVLERARFAHHVRALEQLASAHQVVHLDAHPVVRHLVPPTQQFRYDIELSDDCLMDRSGARQSLQWKLTDRLRTCRLAALLLVVTRCAAPHAADGRVLIMLLSPSDTI